MGDDPLRQIPFLRLLGAELEASDAGTSRLRLDLREDLLNSWGVAHGGVLMTLLDVAMARAGRSLVGPPPAPGEPSGAVTVEMKTSFFRPARGRLLAQGRVLHRSTTMAYCEGEVVDEGGDLVAKALGTFKFLRRLDRAARIR